MSTHVSPRGGPTGAVQLKQLASDYSQQKHTTWAWRGRIIIVNCLSRAVQYWIFIPVILYTVIHHMYLLAIIPAILYNILYNL